MARGWSRRREQEKQRNWWRRSGHSENEVVEPKVGEKNYIASKSCVTVARGRSISLVCFRELESVNAVQCGAKTSLITDTPSLFFFLSFASSNPSESKTASSSSCRVDTENKRKIHTSSRAMHKFFPSTLSKQSFDKAAMHADSLYERNAHNKLLQ